MKKVLITGITGQDGAYLSRFLLTKGYNIIGLLRKDRESDLKNLEFLEVNNKVELIKTNLLDLSDIVKILKNNPIDEIYNLAAQSSVASSFKYPIETIEFNIMSHIKLLEAVRMINPKIKFYQASSSEMFGNIEKEKLPIDKNVPFNPISPYGISKASSHWLTINYRKAYNLFAVCGITFNHESPLRNKNSVFKKILNTAVKISMGMVKELKLGNLNVYRDWGYAPKYVEAMWLMLQQDIPQDYIISSGEAHNIEELVKKVFKKLNLEVEKYLVIDKDLFRTMDIPINYGDNSDARNNLKWDYNISFEQLINQLLKEETQYIQWEMNNIKYLK